VLNTISIPELPVDGMKPFNIDAQEFKPKKSNIGTGSAFPTLPGSGVGNIPTFVPKGYTMPSYPGFQAPFT
jgi:hypothetical protein